jgi:hypothetical protein
MKHVLRQPALPEKIGHAVEWTRFDAAMAANAEPPAPHPNAEKGAAPTRIQTHPDSSRMQQELREQPNREGRSQK